MYKARSSTPFSTQIFCFIPKYYFPSIFFISTLYIDNVYKIKKPYPFHLIKMTKVRYLYENDDYNLNAFDLNK